ncbi:hypothetical protein Gotur_030704 [Gossypium turneri]
MEGASYQRFPMVKIRELKDDYASTTLMPPWPTPSCEFCSIEFHLHTKCMSSISVDFTDYAGYESSEQRYLGFKFSFWVITKLKKRSKSRIERTAGDGCWLQQYVKEVKHKDGGEVIGFDRYFTFTSKKSKKSNGQWVMHEYSLKDQEAASAGLSDSVICEIKNKDAAVVSSDYEESEGEIKKNKKRKLMEVPSASTNDVAIVPEENQTFDYMAAEVGGFSPSPPFSACSNQQPNPWTLAGVDGNLGVPDYNSHHLLPA